MDRYGPSTQRRQPPASAASLAPRGPPRSLRKTWSPERTANAGQVALGQSRGQLKPVHETAAAIEHWAYDGPGGDVTARDALPTARSVLQTHDEPEAASGKGRHAADRGHLPSGHALVDLAAMEASDEAVIHSDSGDTETVEETIAHEDTEARRRHRTDSRFERAGSLAGSAITHTRSLSSLDSRMFGRISRTTVARSHFLLRRHVLGAPEQRARGLGDSQQQSDRGGAIASSQQVLSPPAGQPRNSSGVAAPSVSCSPERSAHGLFSSSRLPVPGLVATPVPLLSRLHPSPLLALPAQPGPTACQPLPLADLATRSLPKAYGLGTSPSAPSLGDPPAALPPWDWSDTPPLSPPLSGGPTAVGAAAVTAAPEVVPAASPPPQAAAAAHAHSPQASPGGVRSGRAAPGAPQQQQQQQQHLRPRRHPPVAEVTVLSQQALAAAQQSSRGGRGLWGGRSASDA